jgi:hypothetical protein
VLTELVSGEAAKVVLEGTAPGAQVFVNGQLVANGLPATLKNVPVGTPFKITVTGTTGSVEQEITLSKGQTKRLNVRMPGPPANVANNESSNTQPTNPSAQKRLIMLRLNITPRGAATLVVNGKTLDVDNPVVPVPVDSTLELIARKERHRTVSREFVIASDQVRGQSEWTENVVFEPVRFGQLTVRTTPSAEAIIKPVLFAATTSVESPPRANPGARRRLSRTKRSRSAPTT